MTDTFQLEPVEIHSWCARLDVPPAEYYAILTEDERSRSARLRFERDRRRFIVARGALRELLGQYLRISPGQVRFVYNAFGKPALSPEFGSRLTFNLSHSADLALIAVAPGADIGVDLECIRPHTDYAEIARCFFSASEVDYLNRVPSHLQTQAFFSCWTKKEAYAKARGEGFAIASTDSAPAGRWSLYTLQPAPGYIGALAAEGAGWRLTHWHWQPRR